MGVCALCGATRTDSNVFVQYRDGHGYGAMRRQLYDLETKSRSPRKRRRGYGRSAGDSAAPEGGRAPAFLGSSEEGGMTDYTALSNGELSRAVAERCGWKSERRKCAVMWPHNHAETGCMEPLSHSRYAESMDACLAPGGPVEWLEEHPDLKYMGLYRDGGAFRWECEVFLGIREVMRHAEMPSRAFGLAFMAATDDGGAA